MFLFPIYSLQLFFGVISSEIKSERFHLLSPHYTFFMEIMLPAWIVQIRAALLNIRLLKSGYIFWVISLSFCSSLVKCQDGS